MNEGTVLSVHDDAGNNYQNTSGFNAVVVLTIEARNTGGATLMGGHILVLLLTAYRVQDL